MLTLYAQYYEDHKACPICGNSNSVERTMRYYDVPKKPDENITYCYICGWRGIVDSLLPYKN